MLPLFAHLLTGPRRSGTNYCIVTLFEVSRGTGFTGLPQICRSLAIGDKGTIHKASLMMDYAIPKHSVAEDYRTEHSLVPSPSARC